MSKRWSRRGIFQAAGAGAAAAMLPSAAEAAATLAEAQSVYAKLGVKPFINMTATYTINGGAPILPEVRQAMDSASQLAVNLDELMERAGARVAELLGGEAAIITSGAAAALCHGTAACIAGGDPEKMKRLPDSYGMKNEVLIAKQSRNDYDHAFRTAGGKLVEFDTAEEFHAALSHRTAMVAVLGTGEAKAQIRLEQIAEAAHKRGVPVIVDAAAELPHPPNPYLSRGADLVAYSGGKILRGPQGAGVLLGRKDLVRAAWSNSAPHHGYGRAMKVSKEEIVGMVVALELFRSTRKIPAEYAVWESWYKMIAGEIGAISGVTTKILPPAGASPFPVMSVAWDPAKIKLTGQEVHDQLLNGNPRIMSHAGGEATSFVIRAVAMRPEHPALVAKRLSEVFRSGMGKTSKTGAAPAVDVTGSWEVDIEFSSGKTRHTLVFDPASGNSNKRRGLHIGQTARQRFQAKLEGDAILVNSTLPLEGMTVHYAFSGKVQGNAMTGEISLGEFGKGRFTARRLEA